MGKKGGVRADTDRGGKERHAVLRTSGNRTGNRKPMIWQELYESFERHDLILLKNKWYESLEISGNSCKGNPTSVSMHKSLLPEFLKYLERTRSLKRTLLHLLNKDVTTPCQEKPSRHYSQHHRAQKLLPEPNNIKRLMQNDSSCQECNAASAFKILM